MANPASQDRPESLKDINWRALKYSLIHELHQTPELANKAIQLYMSRIVIRQLIALHKKHMPTLDEEERDEFRREVLKAFKTIMDESPYGIDRVAGMEFVALMKEEIKTLKQETEEMDAAA